MKRLQLIFCVEANQQSKSDFMYIEQTIKQFYDFGDASVQIRPVYMNGKGNFNTGKIERKIEKLAKPFLSVSKENESYVLFCFDCDEYDSNAEDAKFLVNAKTFCENNWNYRFVWFCRDIEEVYLGKMVENHQKKKRAESFIGNKMIETVNIQTLSCSHYHRKRSNLCLVLDEFLHRKMQA